MTTMCKITSEDGRRFAGRFFRRLVEWLAVFCCGFTCVAAPLPQNDPLACLDDDLRAAFFHVDYEISRELLDSLPATLRRLEPPKKFQLVGSVRSPVYARVGFTTDLDVPTAEQGMVHALAGLGYAAPATGEARLPQSGFRIQQRPRGQVSMCHPNDGSVLIRTRPNHEGTIVTATRYYQNDPTCVDQRLRSIVQGKLPGDFLPDLQLPEDARVRNGGSGGSTGNQGVTRTIFASEMGLTELLAFFEKQIARQGWRLDGEWGAEATLGSVWSASAARDRLRLVGLLEVRALDEANFETIMSISLYD